MGDVILKQISVGPMQNFAYVIGDLATRKGAIVDPGWEAEKLLAEAEAAGLTIEAVLLTHSHFDHIQALEEVLRRRTVPVYVHALESRDLPAGASIIPTHDGSEIQIGEIAVRCHHRPGHTPGGQCFEVGGALITGDTLFIDACGRVDLPRRDPQAMQPSLAHLARMDDDLIVYPGHDYGKTPSARLGEQKRTNPHLRGVCEGA